jgi:uncharacterized protein involved in exopolysaccharide biosynthesis
MPDLFYLISKWWKQLLLFVLVGTAIATVVVFLQPKKYLATTTALAASPFVNDKSRIFSENIQALYPSIGTSDELDVVMSTAQLDTVYIAVAEELQLQNHYKMREQEDAAIDKAAFLLKADTKIRKGDYGELKIKVWHREKELAPKIANAIAGKLQSIHQHIQNASNIATTNALSSASKKIRTQLSNIQGNQSDPDESMRKAVLMGQLQQYEMLSDEFQVVIDSRPEALIIVERAKISSWPDKPRKLVVIITALVLSFLFGLLLILVLERRNTNGATRN